MGTILNIELDYHTSYYFKINVQNYENEVLHSGCEIRFSHPTIKIKIL